MKSINFIGEEGISMVDSIRRLSNLNNREQEQKGKNKKTKKTDEFKKFFDQVMDESKKSGEK
jgi:hypothetical protein